MSSEAKGVLEHLCRISEGFFFFHLMKHLLRLYLAACVSVMARKSRAFRLRFMFFFLHTSETIVLDIDCKPHTCCNKQINMVPINTVPPRYDWYRNVKCKGSIPEMFQYPPLPHVSPWVDHCMWMCLLDQPQTSWGTPIRCCLSHVALVTVSVGRQCSVWTTPRCVDGTMLQLLRPPALPPLHRWVGKKGASRVGRWKGASWVEW